MVATTLWSIWKTRNDLVFNNNRSSFKNKEFALKSVTFNWLAIRGWIQHSAKGLESIWINNPQGFIKVQILIRKDKLMELLLHYYDCVGFIDGSWI